MPEQNIAEERRAPIKRENRKRGGDFSISDAQAAELDSLASATTEPEAPEKSETAPEPTGQSEPAAEDTPAETEAPPKEPEASTTPEPESRPEESTDEEAVAISKAELEQLKRGSMMQADYTRKTQAVAAKDKELEAERQVIRERRERYDANLAQLEETMVAAVPKEINWAEIRARMTPDEYARTRDEYDVYQRNLNALQAERKKIEDERKADQARQWNERLTAEQQKLYEKRPELLDEAKRKAWQDRVIRTAKEKFGFTDEELAGPIQADHRIALLLDAVAGGDTRAPVTKKPPVPKSVPSAGAQGTPKTKTALEEARARLAAAAKSKTGKGSIEAAGDYFEKLLAAGKKV